MRCNGTARQDDALCTCILVRFLMGLAVFGLAMGMAQPVVACQFNPIPCEGACCLPDGSCQDVVGEAACDALVRPIYKGLSDAGVEYVKIDQLRHMLYDNLHNNTAWCRKKGIRPDDVFRAYLRAARQELGKDVFILSCWGVLPESVGLADACRIGGEWSGITRRSIRTIMTWVHSIR